METRLSESKITRTFADGSYDFDLTFPLAVEFERLLKKSLFATMTGIMARDFRINDLAEIIRLALIGGGTDEGRAIELVEAYVKGRPAAANLKLASDILEAAFFGERASDDEDAVMAEADRVFGGSDD